MSEQTDDPEEAVRRLERALERIAHLAGQPPLAPGAPEPPETAASSEEIASRLDELIDRLRSALGSRSR
jgi:hypothetical protein